MIKNIPNILTISRFIATLIIIMFFYLNFQYKFLVIYLIFIFAVLTDFLDGYFARKFNSESDFGIVFDSLFDKILTLVLYMLLISFDIIPQIIFILLLIREVFVDGLKNYLLSKKNAIKSIFSGKLKFVFQVLLLNFCLLFLISPNQIIFQQFALLSGIIALIFAYVSMFIYLSIFINFFKCSKK